MKAYFWRPGNACRVAAGLWLENVLIYFVPPTGVPVSFNVQPSARVFLFAALVGFASALISGIPPAFQLVQRSLVDALKQGGRGGTRSGHAQRISGALVVAETGLALAALVMLGLFVRAFTGQTTLRPVSIAAT